jgi:hypothetical protein
VCRPPSDCSGKGEVNRGGHGQLGAGVDDWMPLCPKAGTGTPNRHSTKHSIDWSIAEGDWTRRTCWASSMQWSRCASSSAVVVVVVVVVVGRCEESHGSLIPGHVDVQSNKASSPSVAA